MISFIGHVSLDILRYEYVFNFGHVYIPTCLVELATEYKSFPEGKKVLNLYWVSDRPKTN